MFDYFYLFEFDLKKYTLEPIVECKKFYCNSVRFANAPYIDLTIGYENYLRRRSGKFLYNIRRGLKKIELVGNVKLEFYRSVEDVTSNIDLALNLMLERWKNKHSSSRLFKKGGFEYYRNNAISLAESSNFLLVCLFLNTECISMAYCLVRDKKIYVYMHATKREDEYEKFSPGKILYYKLIEYAFTNNFIELDFMIGDEPYKYEWTEDSKPVYRNIFTERKFYLLLIHQLKLISVMFHCAIRRTSIYDSIKRLLRK